MNKIIFTLFIFLSIFSFSYSQNDLERDDKVPAYVGYWVSMAHQPEIFYCNSPISIEIRKDNKIVLYGRNHIILAMIPYEIINDKSIQWEYDHQKQYLQTLTLVEKNTIRVIQTFSLSNIDGEKQYLVCNSFFRRMPLPAN